MSIALDASALLAFLKDEEGAERVAECLENCLISSVNLNEVVTYYVRKGQDAASIQSAILDLGIVVVNFDEAQSVLAAGLYPKTSPHGLSLGDRACLALALSQNAQALTADRIWKELDVDVDIQLIR